MNGQLVLDLGRVESVDTAKPRRPTASDLGLRKLGPGPERLLAELLRRGLDRDHLRAAAVIVLELEERAIR